MKRFLFALAIVLVTTLAHAEPEQPPSNQDYGMDSIVVSKNEQITDQKYGGFPNNKHFNNDTKCIAVKNYFADSKKSSLDADFIRYAVPSLASMDIIYSTANNAPFLRNHIDPMLWKVLIINYGKYCLENPSKTLLDATLDIYKTARSSFWRD